MFDLNEYLKTKSSIVERYLKTVLPTCVSTTLQESMNYSLMAGGKRIRPVIALISWDMLGGSSVSANGSGAALNNGADAYEKILPLACALEMIHTYSLIHDDLPAMDNDDLRRGKPTNHKVYGDAIAILAGDALLTQAFAEIATLAKHHLGDRVSKTIKYVADAIGMNGMVGGQVLDIQNNGKPNVKVDQDYLYRTSHCKTGALITASVVAPAILLGRDDEVRNLEGYGKAIGVAFQIVDDILGVTATKEELGKTPNIDMENKKATFVTVLGVDGAKSKAKQEIENAKKFISDYGIKAEPLIALANYIVERHF